MQLSPSVEGNRQFFLLNLKIHYDVHKKYPNDPYTEPNKSSPHCHVSRIHFSIILLLNLLHVGSWNFKFQISCPFSIALNHQKECTRKSEALRNILQYASLFDHMGLLRSPPKPIFIWPSLCLPSIICIYPLHI